MCEAVLKNPLHHFNVFHLSHGIHLSICHAPLDQRYTSKYTRHISKMEYSVPIVRSVSGEKCRIRYFQYGTLHPQMRPWACNTFIYHWNPELDLCKDTSNRVTVTSQFSKLPYCTTEPPAQYIYYHLQHSWDTLYLSNPGHSLLKHWELLGQVLGGELLTEALGRTKTTGRGNTLQWRHDVVVASPMNVGRALSTSYVS